jgi:hypothetical protein
MSIRRAHIDGEEIQFSLYGSAVNSRTDTVIRIKVVVSLHNVHTCGGRVDV